ncbi:MAG: hypothetical protein AAF532_14475 [Planctomycetota bacterium]
MPAEIDFEHNARRLSLRFDRLDENAVDHLRKCFEEFDELDPHGWWYETCQPLTEAEADGGYIEWFGGPIGQWRSEDAVKFLAHLAPVLDSLVRASECGQIKWGVSTERPEHFLETIFDLNEAISKTRELGHLLRIAERDAIARKDYERLLELFGAHRRLAACVAARDSLIDHLTAISLEKMLWAGFLEAMAYSPDLNFYDFLKKLGPLRLDRLAVIRQEFGAVRSTAPWIIDAADGPRSPRYWLDAWEQGHDYYATDSPTWFNFRTLELYYGDAATRAWSRYLPDCVARTITRMSLSFRLAYAAAAAEPYLLAAGFSADDLDDRPKGQLVAMFTEHVLEDLEARWAEAVLLAPTRRRPLVARLVEGTKANVEKLERGLIPDDMGFHVLGAYLDVAEVIHDGHAVAVLIEALRHHVATHGSLPDRLDQIVDPDMPLTELPFVYRRNANGAVIEVFGREAAHRDRRFVIRFDENFAR